MRRTLLKGINRLLLISDIAVVLTSCNKEEGWLLVMVGSFGL